MIGVVKKWGKSAAVHILSRILPSPQAIPVKAYDLDSLLSKTTPADSHQAVDFGPPCDKEVW